MECCICLPVIPDAVGALLASLVDFGELRQVFFGDVSDRLAKVSAFKNETEIQDILCLLAGYADDLIAEAWEAVTSASRIGVLLQPNFCTSSCSLMIWFGLYSSVKMPFKMAWYTMFLRLSCCFFIRKNSSLFIFSAPQKCASGAVFYHNKIFFTCKCRIPRFPSLCFPKTCFRKNSEKHCGKHNTNMI